MWNTLVDHHTHREYANYVFRLEQFLSHKYTRDKSKSDWLKEMMQKRRELAALGKRFDDEEMIDVILTGVTATHREVIRQYSKSLRAPSGGQTVKRSLDAVMNTLLAETEVDKLVEEHDRKKIMHTNSKGQPKGSKCKRPYRQRRGNCNYCGIAGHWARDCRKKTYAMRHGEDAFKQTPETAKEEKTKKQKISGKSMNNNDGQRTVRSIGAVLDQQRPITSSSGDHLVWYLDTCSSTHVCADRDAMVNARPERGVKFEVWTGETTECVTKRVFRSRFSASQGSRLPEGGASFCLLLLLTSHCVPRPRKEFGLHNPRVGLAVEALAAVAAW
ncbi:TPA: hypothetical protein N0F65_003730 [Lagenidium giganteum]|uniref:CCHC-type domain-containing protein n=1 Tax=Lagenidium giganteum TaxID=4803 RepID=A0AAV2Z3A7_9STRA|nr:TPA: hypothetical protein N0F65_003730 [Lagenidium giganteum]